MSLLAQIAGAVVAVITVAALTGRDLVRSPADAARVAVVAVAAVLAVAYGRDAVAAFDDGRKVPVPPPADAAVAGGRAVGVDVAFVDWVAQRVPRDATFALFPLTGGDSAEFQWSTFQLYPRRAVVDPADADYAVFYRVAPAQAEGFEARDFERPQLLAPDFGIARRRAG